MSKTEFANLLERHLSPILRRSGFLGDTFAWKRIREPFIDCVDIQTRSDGAACCVNLGEHLTFLPVVGGSAQIEPEDITSVDCEIKSRVAPMGEAEHWWNFENREGDIEHLVKCFHESSEVFFGKYQNFPKPFVDIEMSDIENDAVVELLPTMTKVRRILLVARVYDHLGDGMQATLWAEFGKENARMAVGPKAAFGEIVRKYK